MARGAGVSRVPGGDFTSQFAWVDTGPEGGENPGDFAGRNDPIWGGLQHGITSVAAGSSARKTYSIWNCCVRRS